MNREELETLLAELDDALVKAFPGPEPIRVLVVGGACLLFAGVTTRPTQDIDVIITDLFGLVRQVSLLISQRPHAKSERLLKKLERVMVFVGMRGCF